MHCVHSHIRNNYNGNRTQQKNTACHIDANWWRTMNKVSKHTNTPERSSNVTNTIKWNVSTEKERESIFVSFLMIFGFQYSSLLSWHVYVSSFVCSVFVVDHLFQKILSEYSMNSEKWKMMSCTTIYFNYCKKLFVLKWMNILNMISSGIILNFGVSTLLHAQICIQINEREVEQRMLLIVTKFSSIQSFLNELHFFPRNNNVSFNGWSRFSLVILWKEQIRKSTNSLLNPPHKTL